MRVGQFWKVHNDVGGFLQNILGADTEYSMVTIDSDDLILLWNEGVRSLHGVKRGSLASNYYRAAACRVLRS